MVAESNTTERLSMHAHYMGYVSKFLFVSFFGFLFFFFNLLSALFYLSFEDLNISEERI